ncbi:MAG: hypothetical protein B7Z55_05130 [Planctomycetales bacterium 12-60-4]|nr:MAG: hypothetical protein B7Z55_05130 [Planctomycetales bacterium 12-60-4]
MASTDSSNDARDESKERKETAKPAKPKQSADTTPKQPTAAEIVPPLHGYPSTDFAKTLDIWRDLLGNAKSSHWTAATVKSLLGEPVTAATAASAWGAWSKQQELDDEIGQLRKQIAERSKQITEEKRGSKEAQQKIESLQQIIDDLTTKEKLRHLLDRVGPQARMALLNGKKLENLFKENESCRAYVVSIDLRRSTDLMLKARQPRMFATFISGLAQKLRDEIIQARGVFDKFTGDGILAFFPEFFSGPQAGLLAIEAAQKCHSVFADHYRECRKSFTAVLRGAGLGIGVDYGEVSVVQMHSDMTVVGSPVVYACRLSGADAGTTLANQPAYEALLDNFSEYLDFEETEIEFKHEGAMVAYRVTRNEKPFLLTAAPWEVAEAVSDAK